MKIIDTIKRALASAGMDTQAGPMPGVADTIQQALSAAGLNPRRPAAAARATVIDAEARGSGTTNARTDGAPIRPNAPAKPAGAGEFVSREYRNEAGTRSYKLYLPVGYAARLADTEATAMPMVVMLHGCTQTPDDFAAGTRMNALADRYGFLVVYPEQTTHANGSKCWNWFRPGDQDRGRGEPSLIAGITGEVASNYRVDARRIFVAGLSAGAAMAVILGATYPELYAAVGAHSGLPHGAAHDMPSAFGAMNGGGVGPVTGGLNPRVASKSPRRDGGQRMPTIVFHGDLDHTVHARNGDAIVAQATAGGADELPLRASVHDGVAADGRSYRHTVYADADSRPVVEQWELHGAGHAWSGGSSDGSYTDVHGPDASAEMIRFFYAQPRAQHR